MGKKVYSEAVKFRCILRLNYDPVYRYRRRREPHVAAGLTEDEIIAEIGSEPSPVDHEEAIDRTLDYTFDSSRGPFIPGRFNTERFAALYTAKAPETAETERRHHWPAYAGEDPAFVIFSISYTGTALDIRPEVASGDRDFPDAIEECQPYAAEAKGHICDGIAAPSKRDLGGSCCAIFVRDAVEARAFERYGTFA